MPLIHHTIAQPSHWVAGHYYEPLDIWENGYWLTEGEIFESLDTATTIEYYSLTHIKLTTISVVDDAMENMR